MNKSNLLENIDFHDSVIIDFHWKYNSIVIEFENVLIGGEFRNTESGEEFVGGKLFYVSVIISHVSSLLIDDKAAQRTSDSLMAGEDASVLDLDIEDRSISLFVEWDNYAMRENLYRNYNITGEEIAVLIGDETADN